MSQRGAGPSRRPGQGGPARPAPPPPGPGAGEPVLPLYREACQARPVLPVERDAWAGNAGLWWSKLCDRWQPDFSKLADTELPSRGPGLPKETRAGKAEWILSLVHPRDAAGRLDPGRRILTGERALLAEHARRHEALVAACGGTRRVLRLEAPFVTGTGLDHPTENGFLFHHTLGVPYLPGTGVKGLVRAWAREVGEPDTARVLGKAGTVGSVVFLDALPVEPVQLTMEVMTPHYAAWYQASEPAAKPPADWHDPTPIPFLAVAAGAGFAFAVLPRRPASGSADCDLALRWLTDALLCLGAGAKTAVGFGRFGPLPQAAARQQGQPAGTKPETTPQPRLFVGGEPVTVLRRQGGDALVRFANGDTDWVAEDDIERR